MYKSASPIEQWANYRDQNNLEYLEYKKIFKIQKKYFELKSKYSKLKWGFGVEQEFPIFIKLSDNDKENLKKFDLEHIHTWYKISNSIRGMGFNLNPTLVEDNQGILKKQMTELEKTAFSDDLSQKINEYINKFIELENTTFVSTITIFNKINTEYQTTLKKVVNVRI